MNALTAWLPIAFFAFIVACIVVILCAFGRFVVASGWMHIVCYDNDGKRMGRGKWERIPKPERIDAHGLNHVVKYVARMVQSPASSCSLIIASLDRNKACLIVRQEGQLKVLAHVMLTPSSNEVKKPFKKHRFPPQPPEPEKEHALRALFAELQIAPDMDMVHDYNGYADAMRELRYPIGNEVGRTTMIIQRLLREVYAIQETDGLDFTFQG